jgi:hypothetical protein
MQDLLCEGGSGDAEVHSPFTPLRLLDSYTVRLPEVGVLAVLKASRQHVTRRSKRACRSLSASLAWRKAMDVRVILTRSKCANTSYVLVGKVQADNGDDTLLVGKNDSIFVQVTDSGSNQTTIFDGSFAILCCYCDLNWLFALLIACALVLSLCAHVCVCARAVRAACRKTLTCMGTVVISYRLWL